ncbi:DUF1735 and LamG domain-containing protein [Sphingobacterium sp. Mn56C]|uniref:DUF1735 and LamG domain-containing protein n=1 Tax=Sphingobacterium sp. Mn56C TaxID=3395261 RepID=UPI003BE971E6
MRKQYFYSLGVVLCLLTLLISCKNDESFTNKLFISTGKIERIINKPSNVTAEYTLKVAMANLESQPVTVGLNADPSKVSAYTEIYKEQAEVLPATYYHISNTTAEISPGSVESAPVTVTFDQINTLDREKVFVLPISLSKGSLDILASQQTVFYVVKGGALIDVVADMEDNYLHIDQWKTAAPVNNLEQLTLEALIRVRNFDRMISTVMGIENQFLIRLGDANFPPNQIQVATSAGNMPGADAALKGLPANKWIHVAVTFNNQTRKIRIYVDGKLQSEGNSNLSRVSFGVNGSNGFYIGRSYADDRFLAGEFAECRIWNIERSAEEIAANPYEVSPTSEGLVAYWKCNEGVGSVVKDYTANGNDLTAKKAIKWNAVSLPAK